MRPLPRFAGFALLIGFAAALVVATPTPSRAADEDIYRENTDISRMFHKLGRGCVNVLTGWIEIPKNIAGQWRETDPFTGTVLGAIRGIGWAFGRTVAGVFEIVTFPFPIPRDYQPIMRPEFILPSIWGESLPIFQDEYMTAKETSPYYVKDDTLMGKEEVHKAAAMAPTAPY